jgi:Glutaminase
MQISWLLCFLFSLSALASHTTSKIYDVEYSRNGIEPTLVFLTSGKVLKVRAGREVILSDLLAQKTEKDLLDFKFNRSRYIQSIRPASPSLLSEEKAMNFTPAETYVPTTISSMKIAKQYFNESPYNPKDSQCFNRAMVWSYEWWKNHSLKSNKILIFFTRNYIRRYNFEWWFHISPYVHVMDGEKVVERVMDVKYTNGPRTFRQWTNIFMKNDAECPIITKYSEYADYPYTGECYITRTNMYTYQPADLQMAEAWGYQKSAFNMVEVRGAYLEAFDINL